MTGIIVFMRTNLSTIDDLLIDTIIYLKNVKVIIKRQAKGAMMSVSFPIQHSKDFIIPSNTKRILANSSGKKEKLAKKVNYVLLFIMTLS